MLKNNHHHPLNMEITILSAQGLKTPSSPLLLPHRLRPFITVTTYTPLTNGDKPHHVYKTSVDDEGGVDPTWGDKFHLPLDPNLFYQTHSSIYLQLYTKRFMVGPAQLGWCQIPAGDLLPAGTVRHLSYRLRDRDGTRGQGVVNVAVRLEGLVPVVRNFPGGVTRLPEMGECRTVIGIPLRMLPAVGGQLGVSCKEDKWPPSAGLDAAN